MYNSLLKPALIAFISILSLHCAPINQFTVDEQEEPVIDDRGGNEPPTFPVPVIPNEFLDTSVVTNGTTYWKTTQVLNSKVPITSGGCFISPAGEFVHGEQCSDKTLPYRVAGRQPTQIYRLNIGQIHTGEVFQILSQYELTNPTFHTVMLEDTVILSANPDETRNFITNQNSGTDPMVVPHNGENCSPSKHHCVSTKVGSFMVDQAMNDYFAGQDVWVIVLAYSQNIHWRLNWTLDVGKTYGSLSVLKQ